MIMQHEKMYKMNGPANPTQIQLTIQTKAQRIQFYNILKKSRTSHKTLNKLLLLLQLLLLSLLLFIFNLLFIATPKVKNKNKMVHSNTINDQCDNEKTNVKI